MPRLRPLLAALAILTGIGCLGLADEVAIGPIETVERETYRTVRGLHFDHFSSTRQSADQSATRGDSTALLINRRDGEPPKISSFESHVLNRPSDAIESKLLVIYRSGRLKGTGILVDRHTDPDRAPQIRLWLPALRKVRRLTAPDPADAWSGSVFTFDEVVMRRIEDQHNVLIGMDRLPDCVRGMRLSAQESPLDPATIPADACGHRGKRVYRVHSTPVRPSWYSQQRSLIDPETHAPYRVEYYRHGTLIKTIETDWQPVPGGGPQQVYPHFIFGRSLSEQRESLILVPPETVRFNQPVKLGFWSERTLRKIRR